MTNEAGGRRRFTAGRLNTRVMNRLGRSILTGVVAASALVAAASGPIDQQQTEHPFADGGLTCFTGLTGGSAQGVIPGVSQWGTVSAFLFTGEGHPDPEPVTLEIRASTPEGPSLTTANATVPGRAGAWVEFTLDPPVSLTPGLEVFLYIDTDDRVAWAGRRADVYPGRAFVLCGPSGPFLFENWDFTFITRAPEPADRDGDGLADDRDPDVVGDAVEALPDSAIRARGHRDAIQSRLDDAEALILAGDVESARRMLENLRRRLDGCETAGVADADDWIVDCVAQGEVRAVLDALIASL